MSDDLCASALTPRVFKFFDVDEFRSSVRNISVEFTPLVRRISAEQVILNLPGVSVNFIKSFPRIIDAQLAANCTAVGFLMDEGMPIRFNGIEWDQSVIAIGSNGAVYNAVERVERQYASIIFTPQIEGRGWPEPDPSFKLFQVTLSSQRWLRALVLEILSARSGFSEHEAAAVLSGIRESLLAGIDAAFANVVPARWVSHANSARRFKIFQDLRALLSAKIGNPIYSADLAKQLGVSVRTIHDAVLRYRGMSLHRYLRLQRLWLVRRQLLEGTQSVKASALAFGFWHFGDFSRSYRAEFGETPSETLARARSG
jgi:AraC family ethanolamine operon transcriptional activator